MKGFRGTPRDPLPYGVGALSDKQVSRPVRTFGAEALQLRTDHGRISTYKITHTRASSNVSILIRSSLHALDHFVYTTQGWRSAPVVTERFRRPYSPTSTSKGLSTSRSGDSRSHHWCLVVDGNVAYHLTHNTGKSRNKSKKRCEHQDLNPGG
jgi:hypothetical protein